MIKNQYEGTIRFESVENEGTTFILSFPASLIEKDATQKETVRTVYSTSKVMQVTAKC